MIHYLQYEVRQRPNQDGMSARLGVCLRDRDLSEYHEDVARLINAANHFGALTCMVPECEYGGGHNGTRDIAENTEGRGIVWFVRGEVAP